MAKKKVKITQVKSAIGYRHQATDTLRALGIKKMNGSVIKVVSPAIEGMIVSAYKVFQVASIAGPSLPLKIKLEETGFKVSVLSAPQLKSIYNFLKSVVLRKSDI